MKAIPMMRAPWRTGLCLLALCGLAVPALSQTPAKGDVEATMRRATQFMVEKVSYRGGYLWNYLPDMSRRWGEMEARETHDLAATAGHVEHGSRVPRRVSRHRRRVLLPRRGAGGVAR